MLLTLFSLLNARSIDMEITTIVMCVAVVSRRRLLALSLPSRLPDPVPLA